MMSAEGVANTSTVIAENAVATGLSSSSSQKRGARTRGGMSYVEVDSDLDVEERSPHLRRLEASAGTRSRCPPEAVCKLKGR